MNSTDLQDVSTISPISREEVLPLALGALDQLLAVLSDLDEQAWHRPTVCDGWTVDDMVGHMIGAAKSNISVREMLRQQLHGLRHRGDFDGQSLDAANALQVREHAHLTPSEKLAVLADVGPRAARARATTPGPLRPIPLPMGVGGSIPQAPPRLTLGRLNEVIYTRDTWLHRVDIARAADVDPRLDSDVDRRLLDDVVAEWAATHGRPVQLHLEGPAGGTWQQGHDGPTVTAEVADFLWGITGRGEADGLLGTWVMF